MHTTFILQLTLLHCCVGWLASVHSAGDGSAKLLSLLLAHADASSNFVAAPQQLLALYTQLYAADDAAANEATACAESTEEQPSDVATAMQNCVDSCRSASIEECEDHFNSSDKAIVVANRLRGGASGAGETLAQKLKNLQLLPQQRDDNNGSGTLINAVSVDSRWAHNFQKRDTRKRQFYMAAHAHVYIDAMRKDDIFPYALLPELNASALELSLQLNGLKMLLLRPEDAAGLPQLLQQLSANVSRLEALLGGKTVGEASALDGTGARGGRLWPTLVRLFLPKFNFTHRFEVDGIFSELLNVAGRGKSSTLLAPRIVHEAQIAVGEDGIGDLEQKMVLFWNAYASMRTVPRKFKANHPFMFVVHNRRGVQLLGHVAELRVQGH